MVLFGESCSFFLKVNWKGKQQVLKKNIYPRKDKIKEVEMAKGKIQFKKLIGWEMVVDWK